MERVPGDAPHMRNPKTRMRYRRQVRLQILLPLVLILLLVVVGAVLLWPGSPLAASAYADAALVFLMLPAMLFGLLVLAAFVGGVYLLMLLSRRIPGPAYRVQLALDRVRRQVRRGADIAVRPLMRLSAVGAALRAIRLRRDED
jgi:hypothetical protein